MTFPAEVQVTTFWAQRLAVVFQLRDPLLVNPFQMATNAAWSTASVTWELCGENIAGYGFCPFFLVMEYHDTNLISCSNRDTVTMAISSCRNPDLRADTIPDLALIHRILKKRKI